MSASRPLGLGGGYVFTTVHYIQSLVPIENVVEMYKTAQECGRYPLTPA